MVTARVLCTDAQKHAEQCQQVRRQLNVHQEREDQVQQVDRVVDEAVDLLLCQRLGMRWQPTLPLPLIP